jgi:mRNA interferase YafQ
MTKTTIERQSTFKRDYKREYKTYGKSLDDLLNDVLAMLLMDISLPDKYHDHELTGEWDGFRECHLKPDLLLIYDIFSETSEENILKLIRLGSHSELFGK